ncbi:MAG TPA: hypothetical protein VKJ01_22255, partial [Candidatus Solibacter sp.]|nr:hypothetical protein [Candidatus Solibacter sp.]
MHRFERAHPVMKRTKIHIIHPQRYRWKFIAGGEAGHRALAVHAFLAETVVRRQFDLNRDDLADGGHRQSCFGSAPSNQNPAAADVRRVHRVRHPQRGRYHMAAQLDIDPRTLSPVYIFHLPASTFANLAPQVAA